MRTRDLFIFLSAVFVIYFSVNIYMFIKGYRALSGHFNLQAYTAIYLILALTFIVGKIFERNSSSLIIDVLNVVGGFWLAVMLYLFLLLLFSDILIAVGRLVGIIPSAKIEGVKYLAYLVSLSATILIILSGFINSVSPVVKRYNVEISANSTDNKPVKILAVSDIHLGSVVRKRSMRLLSGMIEKESPDIVFFLGDMVDGEINPVLRDDLLKFLVIPGGKTEVYAITGNHEFIGGSGKTIPYIEKSGLRLLRDEVVVLKNGIQVAGRIDRDSERFSGLKRKSLEELLADTDPLKPLIVLDHQPPMLREPLKGDFDLMLSGHTHRGQMWPFSLFVNRIYRHGYGRLTDGRRNYIVSSGFGTWGPRVRVGSRSEIVVINLSFGLSD